MTTAAPLAPRAKPLPLQGVRVVDFSRLLPGPFASQMLGELGAGVIKVEPPDVGDPSRYNHPQYRENSVYFNAVNAHKRSICVDLSTLEGKQLIRKLLTTADVVIETYRPGVARKLGIGYSDIHAYNSRVVYCSISGFGQTGPLSHIAGHDLVIQGLTGLMGCALDTMNPPAVPGFQAADYAGALMAVIGIQAALAQRAKTGEGCDIDLSMFESLFNMALIPLSSQFAKSAGHSGEPRMESFGGNPRYSTYLSRDGKPVAVTLLETKSWREFCDLANRPDLIPHTESLADRLSSHGERSGEYRQVLSDYCASLTWAQHMERMEKTGIAICPICTPQEALALPHVTARGSVAVIDHPREGAIPSFVNPLARAGLATASDEPAPQLGEHADVILHELGYSEVEVAALRSARVI
jgi:crotonobetainyl-CoA:carnitine CoA-transferase CaiB-like acyl-CoA transferase